MSLSAIDYNISVKLIGMEDAHPLKEGEQNQHLGYFPLEECALDALTSGTITAVGRTA